MPCLSFCQQVVRGDAFEQLTCYGHSDANHRARCAIHPVCSGDMEAFAVCNWRCPLLRNSICTRLHRAGCRGGPGDLVYRALLQCEGRRLPAPFDCVSSPVTQQHGH